jgi:ketosteroid isomerase-like protein
MKSSLLVLLLCITLLLSVDLLSAPKSTAPDNAYLQEIWNGWSTLNPDNVAQFYAPGPHTFFDIAPLKYSSWDEYEKGVRQELADYSSAKFTVNDDATLHPAGDDVWGTATVNFTMTHKGGKVETGNMRWTVVFAKQGGKWLIVHEHVSVPMQ